MHSKYVNIKGEHKVMTFLRWKFFTLVLSFLKFGHLLWRCCNYLKCFLIILYKKNILFGTDDVIHSLNVFYHDKSIFWDIYDYRN